jgi:hypothetical protein
MSKEQNASRFSGRNGFFLGIGTTAVLGALVIMGLQYGGGGRTIVTQPAAQAAVTPEATQTFPLAEHVAAMTESMGQPAATSPAAAPQTSSSPAHSVLLSGTIELDNSIAGSIAGTTTVFVIARDKAGKGHPILARRLDVASFPTTFSLGPQDSMMGTPPPDHVSLEARIDLDGDAMTREPGAPSTKIDSVAIGSRNVKLTLRHSD